MSPSADMETAGGQHCDLKEVAAREVERLEAAGLGHGKALQMVKRRLVAARQAREQMAKMISAEFAEGFKPTAESVLTAQVTSYINQMHRGSAHVYPIRQR